MDVFLFVACLFIKLYNLKKGGVFLEEIFKGLLEQSFPVVVAVYLLVRLEAKLEALERTISSLNERLQRICKCEKLE